MTASRQALGRWGEGLAADYLARRGYAILERNARTPYGEIDLVARQVEDCPGGPVELTVFVEVKTRTSPAFGLPEESVTARKRAHLLAAAQSYLQQHPHLENNWRIDVIAILRPRDNRPPQITHFENAVGAWP
jgi:putative endonuclease